MSSKDSNNFRSVKPVKFIAAGDDITGWSQGIRRLVPEKSIHWDERKDGGFAYDDVRWYANYL